MKNPCPWRQCTCDHVFCDYGWIDCEDGRTKPCPGCRPEVVEALKRPLFTSRATTAEEAVAEWAEIDKRNREKLPSLPRPSRENPDTKPAKNHHRTT